MPMSELGVDAATAEKLLAASGPVVVKDESGRVIGWMRRTVAHITEDPFDPGISEEEFRRLAESGGPTYTTAEVLADVKGLVR
jgi:hypothetical protein